MRYKAYYTFKFKSEIKPEVIYFDYLEVNGESYEVSDADGLGVDEDDSGPEYQIAGSFRFESDDEIDWDDFDVSYPEGDFSLEDSEGNAIEDFVPIEFILTVYSDKNEKLEGSTKFPMLK